MPPLPHRRALVVANPVAGRGRARARAERLADGLRERGAQVRLHYTGRRGDAADAVRAAEGIDLAVCVGGDGTLAEVLSALPPAVPVAVLPMGTANVMASDLRLPRRVAGVLAAIEGGRVQELDTATVVTGAGEARLSFLVTGVGIDGAIVREVEARRRGPISKSFYVLSVLRTLWRHRPRPLAVEVDGAPVPGPWHWVLVSNIVGYGGVLRLSPGRVLDDGLFEVFLFPRGSRWALVGYGLAGLLRRLPGRSCKMVRARRVRVTAEPPPEGDVPGGDVPEVDVEVDGDYGGTTPVQLTLNATRHRLIVP